MPLDQEVEVDMLMWAKEPDRSRFALVRIQTGFDRLFPLVQGFKQSR